MIRSTMARSSSESSVSSRAFRFSGGTPTQPMPPSSCRSATAHRRATSLRVSTAVGVTPRRGQNVPEHRDRTPPSLLLAGLAIMPSILRGGRPDLFGADTVSEGWFRVATIFVGHPRWLREHDGSSSARVPLRLAVSRRLSVELASNGRPASASLMSLDDPREPFRTRASQKHAHR